MNNKFKKNINTAGTVGYIISVFLIIALVFAMVATGLCTAAAALVAKEEVNVTVGTDIDIQSKGNFFENLKGFVKTDDGEDFADLIGESDGTEAITVNDSHIKEFRMAETANGITVNAKGAPVTFTGGRLIAALVITFLYLLALVVMFHMVKYLMKALRDCDTPFTDAVIKKMQHFGWSLIPVILMSGITDSAWGALSTGGNLIDFSLNLGGLLILAIVFVLILVFKYGAELQKESDETL